MDAPVFSGLSSSGSDRPFTLARLEAYIRSFVGEDAACRVQELLKRKGLTIVPVKTEHSSEEILKKSMKSLENDMKILKARLEKSEKDLKSSEELKRDKEKRIANQKLIIKEKSSKVTSYEIDIEDLKGEIVETKTKLKNCTEAAEGLKAQLEVAFRKISEESDAKKKLKKECEDLKINLEMEGLKEEKLKDAEDKIHNFVAFAHHLSLITQFPFQNEEFSSSTSLETLFTHIQEILKEKENALEKKTVTLKIMQSLLNLERESNLTSVLEMADLITDQNNEVSINGSTVTDEISTSAVSVETTVFGVEFEGKPSPLPSCSSPQDANIFENMPATPGSNDTVLRSVQQCQISLPTDFFESSEELDGTAMATAKTTASTDDRVETATEELDNAAHHSSDVQQNELLPPSVSEPLRRRSTRARKLTNKFAKTHPPSNHSDTKTGKRCLAMPATSQKRRRLANLGPEKKWHRKTTTTTKKHGYEPTTDGTWSCVCGKAFSGSRSLKQHIRYFDDMTWECDICHRKVNSRPSYIIPHMKSHGVTNFARKSTSKGNARRISPSRPVSRLGTIDTTNSAVSLPPSPEIPLTKEVGIIERSNHPWLVFVGEPSDMCTNPITPGESEANGSVSVPDNTPPPTLSPQVQRNADSSASIDQSCFHGNKEGVGEGSNRGEKCRQNLSFMEENNRLHLDGIGNILTQAIEVIKLE